ncbi:MAG: phosphoserine phosphatase SerB [Flavobacteriaceae bacterium]
MPIDAATLAGPGPVAVTVIAREGDAPSRDLGMARLRALEGAGEPRPLGPEAAEILFPGSGPAAFARLRTDAAAALEGLAVDCIVEPQRTRRKRLFLADMDSTMIGQECIDELAAELGLKDRIAAITERAMRGEIAFEPALRERVALLKGLDASVVDRVIENRITLTPGARTLVATMRASGAYAALVSGGFTLFTGPVAAMIGFDEERANELLVEDGRLAGLVREPILGRQAKRARLEELIAVQGVERDATLAIGDGANDLEMLAGAGLGVAFRAKPVVAEAADARLDHADLTALLYAQGYSRDAFVSP